MTDLHCLHALAGWPSVTDLAKQLSVGRSTIHQMFTRPLLPNRTVFFDVVELMAKQARRIDGDEWCDRLDARWRAAYDDERLAIDLREALRPPEAAPSDTGRREDPPARQDPGSPPTGGLLPDPARSRAVFIGTADFRDPRLPPLPGVAMGLQALHTAMTRPDLGSFPSAERVAVMIDPRSARPVLDAVRLACSAARDVLFLYLAGHGLLSSRGELLLATTETDADPGAVEYTALPYSTLRNLLANSPARRKVVVLDCCYSGRAIETTMGPLSGLSTMDSSAVILASTGPYSASFLDGPAGLPAMTGALVEILNEGVIEGPELLDLDTLHEEIRQRLALRGFPTPALHIQRRDITAAGNVALGRNPRYIPPDQA